MKEQKKSKNRLKQNKGITLIALVITIVVLLILAGVTINAITGIENVMEKAQEAKNKTDEAMVIEEFVMAWNSCESEYLEAITPNSSLYKSDFFTIENLNKYLKAKGTVQNLSYMDNTTSTAIYHRKEDNAKYRIFIEKGGNIFCKQETMASKITPENYGDKVNYSSPNGVNDWKIFYNDGINIFLITSDYLPIDKVPDESNMSTKNSFIASWSTAPSSLDINNQQLRLFQSSDQIVLKNEYANSRCVSKMLNTGVWESFKDNNYADYAIGGPTIEMYCKSWNEKGYTRIDYQNDENGYYIGTEEPLSTAVNLGDYGSSEEETGYYDSLYYPHRGDDDGTCWGYWISSISGTTWDYLYTIKSDHCGIGPSKYFASRALRPIVVLKSTVNANKENDIWILEE
ncbi:MAG: type II secretion system protein [Clostridia bacterium]|nr:type II secretion system protein [Clostridia bacterium]